MKNLIRTLRKSFLTKMTFIATVLTVLVVFTSCKHDKGGDKKPVEEVTLTFKKGANVTKVEPASVKVKKGEAQKLSVLKTKITKIEFASKDYEFSKLCIGAEDGVEIKEDESFKPMANTDIFVVAKKYGPVLTSIKVDNIEITPIRDEMEVSTHKEKVKIECTSAPEGSKVSTTPPLVNNEWTGLVNGENILNIKVTKDSLIKEYKLKVTKTPVESEGLITSITIGPHTKRGDGIVLEDRGTIEIPVPTEFKGVEYDIQIVTKEEGTTIEYDTDDEDLKTALENGKFIFEKPKTIRDLEKEFSIRVSKDTKESNYKVKVIMMTNAAAFLGARLNGKNTSADLETIKKILKHEDITLNIAGHEAFVVFASQSSNWKTVLCNGENIKINLSPNDPTYTSMGSTSILLGALGSTTDVKVIVSNSEYKNDKPTQPWLATEEFNFKIKCNETAADAFIKEVFVNDVNITDEKKIPEAFTSLFGTELTEINSGNIATVGVKLFKKVQKVKINEIEIREDQLTEEKDNKGRVIAFIAKAEDIDVDETTGKEITIVVSPNPEDVNYKETSMKFKLVYKVPPRLYPASFDINETYWNSIPQGFKDAIKKGKNPLYNIKTNSLGMRFVFYKKPKKVEMIIGSVKTESSEIQEIKSTHGPNRYIAYLSGTASDIEQEVTLGFEPEDTGALSKGELKFKIKGTNNRPKISPEFQRISKDENLPLSFINDLVSGNAEYSLPEENAEILISLTEYEKNFLLNEIKINDIKATDNEFKLYKSYDFVEWRLIKTIDGLTPEGKDVTIKFEARNGIADSVVWKFKLKSGGEKPKVPRYKIRFGVAGYGVGATPFPNEFLIGLEDNTKPIIELYGKNVTVSFTTFFKEYLKEAKFKIDSEEETTVTATTNANNITRVGYTFKNVSKDEEHTIIATVVPNSEDYSPLEYRFRVKILSDLPEPSGYVFGIDNKKRGNGYKATLNKDFATLIFQANKDIVKEVRIGKGETLEPSDKVEITKFKNKYGKFFWHAIKDIDVSVIEFEKWKIEITPNDESQHPKVTYVFELKGTEIPDSNLSFEMEKNEPRMYATATRPAGMDSKDIDDYGVTSVEFTAYTMSKKTKVKGIRVHQITGDDMPGDTSVDFASTEVTRKHVGTLNAYGDKPTKMRLWTTSADGSTIDDVNGVYDVDINPVPLVWSYKMIADLTPGEKAYDEIVVKRKKIKNNKVYMIFAPWKEKYGFTVDLDAVNDKQSKFEKIGALGQLQNMFRTSLDVTGMNNGDEKEIKCVLKHIKTDKNVLEYKVKVKMIE